MKVAIIESLHELAEAEAEQALLPSTLIGSICETVEKAFSQIDGVADEIHACDVTKQIWTLFRANTQRGRELAELIKATRENISALVKAYGSSVKAAGFNASYSKPGIIADVKRLKLDVGDNAALAKYLKQKAHSCRITRSKS